MVTYRHIPEPFQFNPLKHHLGFIRKFISDKLSEEDTVDVRVLIKEVKHIGSSVMDVYTGNMEISEICREIKAYLESNDLDDPGRFSEWAGKGYSDFRVAEISDTSEWTLKFKNDKLRYVHVFPARNSPLSFRVKANTLMSAMLYYLLIGKDYISRRDLNEVRLMLGLSPVKSTLEADAIVRMVEVLRV